MWKKLKDHHRYFTKSKASKEKSGDAAPDEPDAVELDFDMREDLSFLGQHEASSLRSTVSLGGESELQTETGDLFFDESVSNYSFSSGHTSTKAKKKEDRALGAATIVGQSISKYIEHKSSTQTSEPVLKHMQIWQQLEKLFEDLQPADIVDLNFLFISETYKKIQAKRNH